MWGVIALCIVFTMFVISEFVSYKNAKQYEAKLKRQQQRINRLLDEKQKDKETIEQMARRIIKMHETTNWLTAEKETLERELRAKKSG